MEFDKTNIGFFKRVEPYLIDYINGKASFEQTTDHCNDVLVEMKLEKIINSKEKQYGKKISARLPG